MAHARPQGPIQGTAKRGLDAPYEEQSLAGRTELDRTLAGRKKPYHVPRDDTQMKNPDGDLSTPSAMPVKPAKK
jgi:hypothetical protein